MTMIWCEARCESMGSLGNGDCKQTAPGDFGIRSAVVAARNAGWEMRAGHWICPSCARARDRANQEMAAAKVQPVALVPPVQAVQATPELIYVTIPKMAEMLCISDDTFRRHIKRGAVPTYEIGGLVRVKVAEVVAWVESQRRAG